MLLSISWHWGTNRSHNIFGPGRAFRGNPEKLRFSQMEHSTYKKGVLMATDIHGRLITAEEVEGLERFANNNVPVKLCYEPSTCLTFEIDDAFAEENAEDADIYWSILPSQMRDILYIPSVGEELLFAKQ